MVVDKVREINSVRQNKWLQKYTTLITPKRNQAVNNFEKDFYEILNNVFYGKTLEKVGKQTRKETIRKDDNEKPIKQQ